MKIVLLGIQGAGKSTQGNLLSKQLQLPYLSTGHIFREISKEKSALGRYVKETINSGNLIPDEKTIPIVEEYLSRPEYAHGYILDGFPRTLHQAETFTKVDKVIQLDITDREALWRLAERNDDRDDDTLDAIKNRIHIFRDTTTPVLDFYEKKKMLFCVDATQSIEAVNKEILKLLGKQMVKDHLQTWSQRKKIIIGVVGLPGSGKTETVEYLKSKDLPVVSFSDMGNAFVEEKGWPHDEEHHRKMRLEVRKEYGKAAFAILSKDAISKQLESHGVLVINGMRSWEEYTYLKEQFPEAFVYTIALFTEKKLRYERSAKRVYRANLFGSERDVHELLELNMGATIAYADFTVVNNGTLEALHAELETLYRRIYYTL